MNDLPSLPSSSPISSAIHLEFIRSVIDSGEENGAGNVEAFHRSLFLNQHGKDLERFRLDRQSSEERLATLEARLQRTCQRLADQEKFLPVMEDGVPDDRPNAPWNLWDIAMFTLAGIAILCLLLFGVLNVSFNLLESGIVTFTDNPVRAYFWAALLPVGALAVKVGWDFLRSRRLRTLYLWLCLATGVLAVFVWVAAYATIYPTLSRTTAEQIASLSVFSGPDPGAESLGGTTAGGVKHIDIILVAAQAIAEICLSAALGMYMTLVYSRHRPVRLATNPTFSHFDQDRILLEQEVARERTQLANARGDEGRLEHQLAVFVSYARSLYQRETVARKDQTHQKRLLIEEMAGQLRSRLEAIDRLSDPSASSGNGNGSGDGNGASTSNGNGSPAASMTASHGGVR